jgi:6-phosphogluconate dehydrogenase
MGVSGGEEGARTGPSLMPGGAPEAWPHLKAICQSIAAKAGSDPCCDWVGDGGAGHFVKMVHNGIEYADMQLISETFHLLHGMGGQDYSALQKLFVEWNKGELESYLIEITSLILGVNDTDGKPILDKIVDVAGQKGTGKWTVRESLEVGT